MLFALAYHLTSLVKGDHPQPLNWNVQRDNTVLKAQLSEWLVLLVDSELQHLVSHQKTAQTVMQESTALTEDWNRR